MAASRFAHLPVPQNPAADYKKQCVEVPGTKRPGQTGMTPYAARAMPALSLTYCHLPRSPLSRLCVTSFPLLCGAQSETVLTRGSCSCVPVRDDRRAGRFHEPAANLR